MDSSFPSLCFKVLTGICRRWTRKLLLCFILGMTLFFLWLHTLVVPNNPVVITHKFQVLKDNVISKKSNINEFHFIPKPVVYSGDSDPKKRKCVNLKPPTSVPVDTFQPVDQSKTSYVFSAYHDTRHGKNEIRIIGVKSDANSLWCQLWYFDNGNFYVETARVMISVIPEGSGRRFESVWLVCESGGASPPTVVSVSKDECGTPSNYLNVNPVITKRPLNYSFSLCVTPFNLKYDKVDEFLEIMTLNQMFGADHAYFYNYSSSSRIRRITEAMAKEGRATVVQWQLPMKVHVWPVPPGYVEEVKYFGQMAMLQDCLMRGMGKFQYLVYTDMDELAVPRRHRSWRELFDAKQFNKRQPASVVFRNTFFKLEWASDPNSLKDKEIVASGSRALLKTKRETTIYSPGARSKYMIDPLQIRSCGVHNIWQVEKSGGNMDVLSTDDGVLHHYRNWEGMGQQTFDVDRSMLRFRDEIIKRLKNAKDWYKNISMTYN